MKNFIKFPIFIFFSIQLISEQPLYCVTEGRTGFSGNEGNFKISPFIESRFIINFEDDYKNMLLNDRNLDSKYSFECNKKKVFAKDVIGLFCLEKTEVGPYVFIYNINDKRFVYFQGSLYGYPINGPDTTILSKGTCSKF